MKVYIAHVDEQYHRLPYDKYRVPLVDGIAQQDATAHETKVPKGGGNEAASMPFAVKPLHDKPHGEKGLSSEAYDQPDGMVHSSWPNSLPPRGDFAVTTI